MAIKPKANFYSSTQVADKLNISRQTVFRKIKDGKIKAIKVGKNYKIPTNEVTRIIKEGV